MTWKKVTKDEPKMGEDVLTWDGGRMFAPKWTYNVRTKNGWMHEGAITHFTRVSPPEADHLTMSDLNEIMK